MGTGRSEAAELLRAESSRQEAPLCYVLWAPHYVRRYYPVVLIWAEGTELELCILGSLVEGDEITAADPALMCVEEVGGTAVGSFPRCCFST